MFKSREIKRRYKYCFVLGTNAEMIKLAPLMLEMDKRGVRYYFISTGQHDITEMCDIFNVKLPDITLTEAYKEKFHSNRKKAVSWIITTFFKVRKVLRKVHGLETVIVHGDTMSTLVGALSARSFIFNKYNVAHVEAGLRSFDKREPFPEEIIRRIVDRYSQYNFCPSQTTMLNVKHLKADAYNVGNTINDTLQLVEKAEHSPENDYTLERYAVMTIHRHENITSIERMKKIVDSLEGVKVKVEWMMHDNTKNKLQEYGLLEQLENNPMVEIKEPMKYHDFIKHMSSHRCALVITDGGSMQEECLALKKYCIVMRMKTERQEAIETGTQFLTKLDVSSTKDMINHYLELSVKGSTKDFDNVYAAKFYDVVSADIFDILEDDD